MQPTCPRRKKTSRIYGTIVLIWLLSPLFLTIGLVHTWYGTRVLNAEVSTLKNEVHAVKKLLYTPPITPTKTPTPTPQPTKPPQKKIESKEQGAGKWIGKVSHYSRAGCLGCSKTLTMANGQPLDDDAYTIAFNLAPLNTRVRLTNLDNGKSVEAIVTDTGGFHKLGRLADLVPAVANALETKTDITNVLIEII